MNKMTLIFWGMASLALHAGLLFIPGPNSFVQPVQDHLQVAFQTLPAAVVTEPAPSPKVPRDLPDTPPPAKSPPRKQPKPTPLTEKEVSKQPEPLPAPADDVAEAPQEPAEQNAAETDTTLRSQKPTTEKSPAEPASAHANALVEATPLYADNPPPTYPRLARERGWQGDVLLRARVSPSGRVLHVQVEESSGYALLDRAALKAVKGWRFRPARRGSHPVEAEVRLPVRFELQSS